MEGMEDPDSQAQAAKPGQGASQRLDSWKEIAAHLRRDVRTVQRWERNEGLPVHRHVHDKQGTVYAFPAELDAWWHGRQSKAKAGETGAEAATSTGEISAQRGTALLSRRWWIALIPGLVLAAVVAVSVLRRRSTPPGERRLTVAVLPFKDLNAGDPEREYFAAGLSEEMMARLAQAAPGRLRVVPLTAAYRDKSLRQIGEDFKADYVLQGSVRRAGNRVAITGELLQVRDQSQVWADSYDRDLRDVLSMQAEVAEAIARATSLNLHANLPTPQVDPAAYEDYLKGRYFWNKRTPESLFKAIDYFQQAVARQPSYAAPYSGLADCYGLLGSVPYAALPPREAFPKAKVAAERALELDPNLAEAHVSLGYIHLVYDWDAAGAESEMRRALELRPDYATAHQFYAYYLSATGRLDQAIAERQRAQELDPLSPVITASLGEAYYLAGDFDRSAQQYRKALELDPDFAIAQINLGRTEIRIRAYAAAARRFRTALNQRPDDAGLLMLLGYEQALSGDRAGASATRRELKRVSRRKFVPALYMAAIYAGLGDKNQALHYLQKAYEERCDYLVYLWIEPAAKPLRSDPRFVELMGHIPVRPSSAGR